MRGFEYPNLKIKSIVCWRPAEYLAQPFDKVCEVSMGLRRKTAYFYDKWPNQPDDWQEFQENIFQADCYMTLEAFLIYTPRLPSANQ